MCLLLYVLNCLYLHWSLEGKELDYMLLVSMTRENRSGST